MAEEFMIDIEGCEIIDPRNPAEQERRNEFAEILHQKRRRKGVTFYEAEKLMRERNYFAAAMIETGYADAVISGLTRKYPDTIKPALQMIGKAPGVEKIAGMYILITKKGPLFLADTTVNYDPTSQELADIALMVNRAVKSLRVQPNIAMLSYSNFGSSKGKDAKKVSEAVEILNTQYPEIMVDGELQANFALNGELLKEIFPFSHLNDKKVNTLIFPTLSAGNIAYKLIQEMASTDSIGPILLGLDKPFHVLQMGSSVREIVNMVTIAAVEAQSKKKG